jgi:hypothetical protein
VSGRLEGKAALVTGAARATRLMPLGRVAEPNDRVGRAVFLASDESRRVTGQLFHVHGGWTAAGRFPDNYVEAAASRREGGR